MPLPIDGSVFPPKQLAPGFARMREHGAWYTGDVDELRAIYGGGQQAASHFQGGRPMRGGIAGFFARTWWGRPLVSGEERTALHIPMAANIATLSSDLINAEPIHEEFTRWMFDRYIEAGIGLPEVAAVWFPPAPECDLLGGLAIESDERYAGRHTVVICFEEDRLPWDDSASGWNPSAASYGLHELAHIWMVDRLTDGVHYLIYI